jgi:hypothetical protein
MSSHFPTSLRYLNKGLNQNERETFSKWWKEEIAIYGQAIDYYVHNYALSAADNIYGEHTTAGFSDPIRTVMMLDLTQSSLVFSKFGLMGDDDLQGILHIQTFVETMTASALSASNITEPKAGDVFHLVEYGSDRPGVRDGKYFEITERLDQQIDQINPLMGHYVWLVTAKRHDWSFEPGLSGEKSPGSYPTDDTHSGRLSGGTNPQTDTKPVSSGPSADEQANDNINNPNSGPYGDYGY